jgi:hypothetical protein
MTLASDSRVKIGKTPERGGFPVLADEGSCGGVLKARFASDF